MKQPIFLRQFNPIFPAALGHASKARRVRSIVQACADRGVRFITLFAFSTENWQRPQDEVSDRPLSVAFKKRGFLMGGGW